MTTIFVVEDNQAIVAEIQSELAKWQYQVQTVTDWQDVAGEIKSSQADLVLFDITLPSFDGFYWIQEVRKRSQVPIIVISAADIDSNVMHAVAAGADDYLMKPFSMTVLVAKVQALLRRNQQTSDSDQLTWAGNQLNVLTNELSNDRGTAQLTPTEGAMLAVLIHNQGHTVSKEKLLEWLWQGGKYLNENTLNVNISRLRAKLDTVGLKAALRTERGIGYRLVADHE